MLASASINSGPPRIFSVQKAPSIARVAAGALGFLTLIHVLDGSERYGAVRISFDVGRRPNLKGNNASRAPMRTLTLTRTIFALFNHGGAALAQQGAKDVTVEAIPIEKVLNANPEPDGKAYRIDLLLSEGKQVAYAVPPSEAAKMTD